ncbi:MAG: SurA N-terminal domain-containing protein [Rhizomicrobium sp.]
MSRKAAYLVVIGAFAALLAVPTPAQNLSGRPAERRRRRRPRRRLSRRQRRPIRRPARCSSPTWAERRRRRHRQRRDHHEYDLRQRILLYASTSGQQTTPDILVKLRPQILAQLETEQLQIQEARRKNITVSPTDVDKSIDRIVGDNHMTKDQLAELLAKGGVQMSTLRAQIAVQIAWQKAVQDEFQDRVNITPQDIDARSRA